MANPKKEIKKKTIYKDEYYPFYNLARERSFGDTIEVTTEFWRHYQRVMSEFEALQDDLEAMYRNAS